MLMRSYSDDTIIIVKIQRDKYMCDVHFCYILGSFVRIMQLSGLSGVLIKRSRLYYNVKGRQGKCYSSIEVD